MTIKPTNLKQNPSFWSLGVHQGLFSPFQVGQTSAFKLTIRVTGGWGCAQRPFAGGRMLAPPSPLPGERQCMEPATSYPGAKRTTDVGWGAPASERQLSPSWALPTGSHLWRLSRAMSGDGTEPTAGEPHVLETTAPRGGGPWR